MKVIVCGGRLFADRAGLFNYLDHLHRLRRIGELAEGCASGADRFAGEWARFRGVRLCLYPANWREYGKAAGVLRNERMLNQFKPQLVVAFPGGNGTADMVWRAERAGIPTLLADPGSLPELPPSLRG